MERGEQQTRQMLARYERRLSRLAKSINHKPESGGIVMGLNENA
jgi:hypothetical protein